MYTLAVFPIWFLHVGVVVLVPWSFAKLTVSAIYAYHIYIYNSSQHLQPCCGQRARVVTFVSLTFTRPIHVKAR